VGKSAANKVGGDKSQEIATNDSLGHLAIVPQENTPDPSLTSPSDYKDCASFRVEAADHVFTFYSSGSDRLEALIDHIDCAKGSLHLFYYEFQGDSAGHKVREALINAAQRGVEVSLIIDDFGSDAPPEFFAPLEHAGARFAVFASGLSRRYLVRNHQKFAIADNTRVMTGGANISDEYYNDPSQNGWCDLGVAIEGDIARSFSRWFDCLDELARTHSPSFRRTRLLIRQWKPDTGDIQLLLGGPLIRRSHWSYRFKKDLAKSMRLDMVTAYFGPPGSFRRAMAKVARKGQARLVSAGKSDLDGTIDVARLYYNSLLRSGGKVSEFQPSKLHMKLIVVGDCSYFGSANLDRRSIRVNIELMVRVKDKALASRLRELIDHMEAASVPIDRAWYKENAGFWTRARWRFFHWLSLADYRLTHSVSRPN
jgi:cardiolipin synthase A/B